MRTIRISSALLATLLVAAASGAPSRGDEIASAMVQQTSAVVKEDRETHESSEVAELQTRLAALEARLKEGVANSYEPQGVPSGYAYGGPMGQPNRGYGHPANCGCEQCCCCDNCCCSKQGGPFVDAEFVYLKPHSSDGTGFSTAGLAGAAGTLVPGFGAIGPSSLVDFLLDPDYEPSWRFAVGYQLPDGLGVRARYWEFDHRFEQSTPLLPGVDVFQNWDTNVSDIEAFDATDFGGWSLTWSAGFRYVQYEEDRGFASTAAAPTVVVVSFQKSFHGIGLTTGLEGRRCVLNNLGVFANLRASVLMGDETNTVEVFIPAGGLALTIPQQQLNDVKFIYEAQAGADYTLPMCRGGYLFARGGVEVQFWDNFGVSTTTLFADASTGFGGFFAAAGIAR